MLNPVTAQLKKALEAHALVVVERGGALRIEDGRLELEADVFDHDAPSGEARVVVLEMRARSHLLAGQTLVECCGGIGMAREDAVADAFRKMLLGSLHVLIEGLTSHSCQQTRIEHWQRGGAAWKVLGGPLLGSHSGESALCGAYSGFFPSLSALFVETLPPGPHWVRFFLATHGGQVQAAELLLDNEPWEQGLSLLGAHDWPNTQGYRSIRHFFLALPDSRGEVCDES